MKPLWTSQSPLCMCKVPSIQGLQQACRGFAKLLPYRGFVHTFQFFFATDIEKYWATTTLNICYHDQWWKNAFSHSLVFLRNEKTSVMQSMKCKVCSTLANQVADQPPHRSVIWQIPNVTAQTDQAADQLADLPPRCKASWGNFFSWQISPPPIKCQMAISYRLLLWELILWELCSLQITLHM